LSAPALDLQNNRYELPWTEINFLIWLARPTRFERVTFAFGGQRSIQLSYGRLERHPLADCSPIGNGSIPSRPDCPAQHKR
jgi:hypothetical protein